MICELTLKFRAKNKLIRDSRQILTSRKNYEQRDIHRCALLGINLEMPYHYNGHLRKVN